MSMVEVVAASVASTLVSVLIFIVLLRKLQVRWARKKSESFRREEMGMICEELKHLGKNIKGVVVEEGKVDVLYMRKLENGRLTNEFTTVVMNPSFEQQDDEDEKVDEDGSVMAEPDSPSATLTSA